MIDLLENAKLNELTNERTMALTMGFGVFPHTHTHRARPWNKQENSRPKIGIKFEASGNFPLLPN